MELNSDKVTQIIIAEKYPITEKIEYDFPFAGKKLSIPLKAQLFPEYSILFDINVMGRYIQEKISFQNRLNKNIVLIRLDIGETLRHRNPDEKIIEGSHVHIYRDGYGEHWAYGLKDCEEFKELIGNSSIDICNGFIKHCHINDIYFKPALL